MHDVSALNYNTFIIIIISFKMRECYKTKIKEEREKIIIFLSIYIKDACFRLIFIQYLYKKEKERARGAKLALNLV